MGLFGGGNSKIKIPKLIGMPPETYISDDEARNSMPIAKIYPRKPNLEKGLTLFQTKDARKEYTKLDSLVRKLSDQEVGINRLKDDQLTKLQKQEMREPVYRLSSQKEL